MKQAKKQILCKPTAGIPRFEPAFSFSHQQAIRKMQQHHH